MRKTTSYIGVCLNTPPRANLGDRWNATNDERIFANAFVDAYDSKYEWLHSGSPRLNRAMAQEVPVNGFGIADLVTVSWNTTLGSWPDRGISATAHPTVRAFEFKISDWRRGMMQAHRYRFFADVAILVVPATKLDLVRAFLDTFRTINVGLWGFNQHTGAISMHFTPRPRQPADMGHRDRAIVSVIEATIQDPLTP